jgi:hypothetical protein
MAELLAQPLVRAGLLFLAIAVLTGLGALVVSRFRGGAEDEQLTASELLTNFRDLHEQGKLSAQEFRNIKTLLADELQQELNDKGEQGSDDRRDANAKGDHSANAD